MSRYCYCTTVHACLIHSSNIHLPLLIPPASTERASQALPPEPSLVLPSGNQLVQEVQQQQHQHMPMIQHLLRQHSADGTVSSAAAASDVPAAALGPAQPAVGASVASQQRRPIARSVSDQQVTRLAVPQAAEAGGAGADAPAAPLGLNPFMRRLRPINTSRLVNYITRMSTAPGPVLYMLFHDTSHPGS